MVLSGVLVILAPLFLVATADCANKGEKYTSGSNTNFKEALQFLKNHNKMAITNGKTSQLASWNYNTNLTEENKQEMLDTQNLQAEFFKESWKNATSYAWKDFKDRNATIYRWFKVLSVLGTAALPEDKFNELNKLLADMQDVYGKGKVCRFNASSDIPCDLSLQPELTEILINSRNYEELTHVWSQWRDVTGKKVKDKFIRYVELSNEAACLNGFPDAGALWREAYESETFEDEVEELWGTIKPLYEQLHAYVRQRLMRHYPSSNIKPDGPIPAQLLGNMWAQKWSNIFDIVKPFPNKEFVDVTDTMKKKNMTVLDMFKMSEDFFTSLGLMKMTPEFWERSILEKPEDREIICHAYATDFQDGKDFRIKMCTRINLEDLITAHHEMGHIEYFQQYAHQPVVFRQAANPGFHEAVGDVMALSAATAQHLKKVNLIKDFSEDTEAEINSLMRTALDKIAFLPYGYLIDSWRWRIFDGTFTKDQMNSKWWDLRNKYQGVCPPVRRTNEDLDAAAKYHVISDIPYIRYFVSFIIQFQFHKALCDATGHEGPLHRCDIYNNKKAGKLLSDTLSLGSSKTWKEAMRVITRGKTNKMDANPLIEYFEPLMKWLKGQNKNETVGWKSSDPMMCP